ncbi:MAG TPA: M48 family metalloprotease [Candidatus Omnitrophota bacterium]|nr:M48 family metalloprotease [Candidatus Omnitrophota bacterium]
MNQKLLAIFLSASLIGCASAVDRDTSHLTPQGKPKTEEQIVGEQIHRQILQSFHPYTDFKVVRYINNIGSKLAVNAKRKELQYQFTILYSEKIYATSAPGGYIYITTGMLSFLQNEAELAAVLAHEIAELQYPNVHFPSKNEQILNTTAQAGAAIGPMFGPFGSLAALGVVLLQAYNQSSHKTPAERLLESDVVAMTYLVQTDYDPQALIDLQEHFLKAGEKITPYFYDYYQSRPITEERMMSLKKEFQKLPLQDKTLRTGHAEYEMAVKGVREMYGPIT